MISRLRALVLAPLRWLAILFIPDRGLPDAVAEGRYGGAMLVATAAALLAAFTIGGRIDLTDQVLKPHGGPDGPPPSAQAEPAMSDRELQEGLEKARTVELVRRGLGAATLPLQLLMLGVGLYAVTRYVGGRPTMRRAVALASSAALPGAVRSLLETLAATRHAVLAPSDVATLVVPAVHVSSPVAARLAGGLDPFLLWSVALLTLGLPKLASIGWRRSIVTMFVCFALWIALTRLVMGGSPNPAGAPG